jgi:hypothetical protein
LSFAAASLVSAYDLKGAALRAVRDGIGGGLIGLVIAVCGASGAHAQSTTDVICAPYETKWVAVSGQGDLAAMRSLYRQIPDRCPLKASARRTLTLTEQSAPASEQKRHGSAPAAASPSADRSAIELAFWNTIKDSTNPADFQAYLDKYPNGQFASIARIRAASPSPGAAPSPAAPSPSSWVALAATVTRGGRSGWGYGPDRLSAAKLALGYCADARCKVLFSVQGRCVAYMESAADPFRYGAAYGPNPIAAVQSAMRFCGAASCQIRTAGCVN